MLTLTEITKKIRDAKKNALKHRIIELFYGGILDSANDLLQTRGEVVLNFDDASETKMGLEAIVELFESDYEFKRYVTEIDERNKRDGEIYVNYDLDAPFKKPEENEASKASNFVAEDIPF